MSCQSEYFLEHPPLSTWSHHLPRAFALPKFPCAFLLRQLLHRRRMYMRLDKGRRSQQQHIRLQTSWTGVGTILYMGEGFNFLQKSRAYLLLLPPIFFSFIPFYPPVPSPLISFTPRKPPCPRPPCPRPLTPPASRLPQQEKQQQTKEQTQASRRPPASGWRRPRPSSP
jgi:hypothetical protein